MLHALFERQSFVKRKNERKSKNIYVCVCVLHAWFMRSTEKGSVEKEKQRRRQLQRGTLLIFLLRPEIREVGQERSPGERLLGGSLISLAPPAPTTPDFQRFLHPPWSVPCGSQGQPLAPSNEAPGPLPANWVACVRFTSYSTHPCVPAESQHIEMYTYIHTSHPSLWFGLLQTDITISNPPSVRMPCYIPGQAAELIDNHLELIVGIFFLFTLAFNRMIVTYWFFTYWYKVIIWLGKYPIHLEWWLCPVKKWALIT